MSGGAGAGIPLPGAQNLNKGVAYAENYNLNQLKNGVLPLEPNPRVWKNTIDIFDTGHIQPTQVPQVNYFPQSSTPTVSSTPDLTQAFSTYTPTAPVSTVANTQVGAVPTISPLASVGAGTSVAPVASSGYLSATPIGQAASTSSDKSSGLGNQGIV